MKLLGIILVILMVGMVSADQTVKTIEQPFGFVPSTVPNFNYTVTWNIDYPDGISDIQNYEISVIGDYAPSTLVSGYMKETGTSDFQTCSPTYWVTPATSVYGYRTIFDCSSRMDRN